MDTSKNNLDTSSDFFGLRLRALIEGKRISIDAFADEFGIARSTAHNWLNLRRPPLEKHWPALCTFFGVSENYLLRGQPAQAAGKDYRTDHGNAAETLLNEPAFVARGDSQSRSEHRVILNPKHQPPASDPTAQQCADYFMRYLQRASQVPGGLGHVWTELHLSFPESKIEALSKIPAP